MRHAAAAHEPDAEHAVRLHPVRGVLTGALKVRGDRGKALALNAVMVPP